MPDSEPPSFDYALVGGGLQNALIALALLRQRPAARVALVERDEQLGGNHVWCFHAGDIPAELRASVEPLCVKSWPSYDVRFPDLRRAVRQVYSAVSSERLDHVLRAAFATRADCELLTGVAAARVTQREVELADGRLLRARVVISATGPERNPVSRAMGFQKFVGLELELDRPSPRSLPLLMDARVPQLDGFRFFYVLPFTPQRVLIEDTYFSDSPALDRSQVRSEVLRYAAEHGYSVARVVREEFGVLPLPTRSLEVPNPAPDGPFSAGFQGQWFHPTTGYSFPVAARLAALIARVEPDELEGAWAKQLRLHRRQFRFGTFLNRLLFTCFAPQARYSAIERFYRLEEPALCRFYALSMTGADRARIFCAKPPRGFSLRLAINGGTPS